MTSIILGNGLGVVGSSATQTNGYGVAGQGKVGQGKDLATVNAATGNLIIQGQDEFVASVGVDAALLRTYNSQGVFDGDNNDGWRLSLYRSLVVNNDGTLTRIGADGHRELFSATTTSGTWRSLEGQSGGAHDVIRSVSTPLITGQAYEYETGGSGYFEMYDASGRLLGWRDDSGNTVNAATITKLVYTGNLITKVTDGSGQTVELKYYTGTSDLQSINVIARTPGPDGTLASGPATRVTYSYDSNANKRLSQVRVDLTPTNTTDSSYYYTTYQYDGTSNRVTKIIQSTDQAGTVINSTLTISYVQQDGVYRVATLVDAQNRITQYHYDLSNGRTDVTDAVGYVTSYYYDNQGRLVGVQSPNMGGGKRTLTSYTYDTNNNITAVVDADGRSVHYAYDTHGNVVEIRDQTGNTIRRLYDANDRLLAETVFQTPAAANYGAAEPGNPLTTHYVYDANERLNYVVTPENRVTQYKYNSLGLRTSVIQYAGTFYTVSSQYSAAPAYPTATGFELTALNNWVAATTTDKGRIERSDTSYDPTGQVQSITTYAAVDANGNGIAAGSTVVRYVYDFAGRLLMQIDPRSTVTGNPYSSAYKNGTTLITSYAYDGLDRQIVSQDSSGRTSNTSYDDANNKITVVAAHGLTTVNAYNKSGDLTSQTVSGSTANALGTTQYFYDNNGRLITHIDPTGAATRYIWDALGRQVGMIDPLGYVTETIYNDAGQQIQNIKYATALSATKQAGLSNTVSTSLYAVRGGTQLDLAPIVDLNSSIIGNGYRASTKYSTAGTLVDVVNRTALTVIDTDTTVSTAAVPASAKVVLNGILNAGLELLSVDATIATNNGITANYSSSTGILSLTGNVSLSAYQAVLRTLQYQNTATALIGGDRTIDVTVSDSLLTSNIATSIVTVAGTAPPRVDLNGFARGGATTTGFPGINTAGLIIPRATISNGDNSKITGATIKLTSPQATETLAVKIPTGVAVTITAYNSTTGVLTLSGTASNEEYTQILQTLTYKNTVTNTATRSVTITVTDALATSVAATATITTAASSDAAFTAAVAVAAVTAGSSTDTALAVVSDRLSSWLYDRAGRLIYAIDAAGYATKYVYDGAGRKIAETRYATAVTVPLTGRAESLTPTVNASLDRTTRYFYDNDSRLQATLDAAGYLTENIYNSAGQLTKSIGYATITAVAQRTSGTLTNLRPATDANDHSSFNLYNAEGQVTAQIDVQGYLTTYLYDLAGNRTQQVRYSKAVSYSNQTLSTLITAASTPTTDQTTKWEYDALNRVTKQTDYQGTITTYSYNTATGFLDAQTSAAGQKDALNNNDARTTSYQYDDLGRVTNAINGKGSAALASSGATAWNTGSGGYGNKMVYDLAGRKIKTIDANNNATFYYYDQDSRLVYTVASTDNPTKNLATVTQNDYDAFGNVIKITQYASTISTVGLNGGLIGSSSNASFLSAVTASAFTTNANNRKTNYEYSDKRGLLTKVTDARNFTVTSYYNSFGSLDKKISDVGATPSSSLRTDQYTYDARGLKTQTTQDVGGLNLITKVLQYDAFGRARQTQDANGNISKVDYNDRQGRVVTVTDPLNNDTVTTYDAFGRTVKITDRNKNSSTYEYTDSTQTLTTTTAESVITTVITNRHGQKISLATGSSADGSLSKTTYSYDLDSNLIDTIVDQGDTTHLNLKTHNDYDNAGLLKTVTDANGTQTTYQYDAANRVTTRTVDPTGLNLQTKYTYNAFGQAYQVIDANLVVTETVFSNKGETTAVIVDTAGLKLATTYSYDSQGLTLTVTEGLQAAGSTGNWSFAAAANTTSKVTQYVYDKAGRRISQVVDPGAGKLNITTLYAYDANGNMVRKTDANLNVWRYAYDANDRQVYAIDPLGDVTGTFYDNEGRSIKTVQYAKALAGITWGKYFESVFADPPAAQDVQLALTSTAVYSNDFSTGLGGITVSSDPQSQIQIQNQQLAISTKNSTNGTYYPIAKGSNATLSATPVTYRAEFNTGTSANGAGRSVIVGIGFDPGNYYYGILFGGDQATVFSYTAESGYAYGSATTIQDNTTYVIKIIATSTGLKLAFYDKNTGHVANLNSQITTAWTTSHFIASTISQAGQVAQTGYLDNLTGWTSDVPSVNDRTSRSVYDKDGRLAYTIDAMGDVTGYKYDKVGRVIDAIGYAAPVNLSNISDATTASGMAQYVNDGDAANHHARMVYDLAGRAVYALDALNDLTKTSYDGNGNVVRTQTYAKVLPAGTAYTKTAIDAAVVSLADTSSDRINRYVYDKANRRAFDIDALGDVTGYIYDKNGRVVDVARYAQAINLSAAAPSTADVTDKINNADALNQHNRSVYDAAGRMLYSINALNGITQFSYDAAGNVFKKLQYANVLKNVALNTVPLLADMTNVSNVVADSSNDRSMRYVYDAAGRQRYSLQTITAASTSSYSSYVIGVQYDSLGNTTKTVAYANAMALTVDVPTLTSMDSLVLTRANTDPDSGDQITRTQYDAVSRVKVLTDAKGYTQIYAYDALGNKTNYTNQNGYTWTYKYDLAGRMTDEITPQVAVANVALSAPNSSATLVTATPTTTTRAIDTHIVYDAFSNVTDNIQNYDPSNPTQARVTSYRYDALGRQTQAINANKTVVAGVTYGQNVAVYNAASDTASNGYLSGTNTSSAQSIAVVTQFDAMGNAVVSKDQGGKYSYKVYNAAGQLRYDIDADGYISSYGYDAFGNQTTLRRYAKGIDTSTKGASAYTLSQIQSLVATNDLDRTITTTYDTLNRKASVVQPLVYSYDSSSQTSVTASPTTKYQYNAFSEVAQQSQLQRVVNSVSNWTTTYNYYDLQGNATATIDPMGFLTQNQYNAFGKLTTQKQWAKELAWVGSQALTAGTYGVNGFVAPTFLAASVSDTAPTSQYASSFTAGATSSPGLTGTFGTSTANFSQMNGGLVVQDTYGASTTSLAAVQSTYNVSYNSSTALTQQTVFDYNLTMGSVSGTANGNTGGNSNAQRLIGIGNWNGSATAPADNTFGYYLAIGRDASGNNTLSFIQRDGSQIFTHQIAAFLPSGNTAIRFVLDAHGATAYVYSPGTLPSTGIQYRFDVGSNYPTNIAAQIFASKAAGSGSGEATLTINSIAITNGTIASTSTVNLQSRQASNVREIKYQYDNLNQQIATAQVGVIKSSVDAVTNQVKNTIGNNVVTTQYDRVGNIVAVTDAAGATTLSFYNALGQLVNSVGAQHQIYADASQGAVTSATVTTSSGSLKSHSYDALGNQVATTEYAAGSTAITPQTSPTVALPAPAAVKSNLDRSSYYAYDILGRVVKSIDAIGYETDFSYDAYGNTAKVEQDYVDADNSKAYKVQIYAYNGRGLQISEAGLQRDGSLPVHNTIYNAFGDVVGKYLTGATNALLNASASSPQEIYAYDNNGRMTFGKGGDGVATVYLSDLRGNVAAQIVSAEDDLSNYFSTIYSPSNVNAVNSPKLVADKANALEVNGVYRRTETVYDLNGRAALQRQVNFSQGAGEIIKTQDPFANQTYIPADILQIVSSNDGASTILNYMAGAPLGATVTISLAPLGSNQFNSYSMILNPTPIYKSEALFSYWRDAPIFSLDVTKLLPSVGQYQYRISITNPSSHNAVETVATSENASGTIHVQGPGMVGYVAPANQPFSATMQTINGVEYIVFKTVSGSTQSLSGMTAVDLSMGGGVLRYAVVNLGTDAATGKPFYGAPKPYTNFSAFNSYFRPVFPQGGSNLFYSTSLNSSNVVSKEQATQSVLSLLQMGVTPLSQIPKNYTAQSLEVQLSGSDTYQSVSVSNALNDFVLDASGYKRNLHSVSFNYKLTVVDSSGVTRVLTGIYQPQLPFFDRDSSALNSSPLQIFTPTLTQEFDRWGNVLSSSDAVGIITRQIYDESNRLIQKSLPQVTAFNNRNFSYTVTPQYSTGYDANGNVIASVDANGNLTTQAYNSVNRVITQVEATGASTVSSYDVFGDVVVRRNQNQYKTIYAYDKVGNLTGQLDPSKATADIYGNSAWTTYAYDALGYRIGDNRTQIKVLYDAWGRVLSETLPVYQDSSGAAHQQKTTYTYDALGRKITQKDANSGVANNQGTTNSTGNIQSWSYSYYGQLQSNTGMNGVVTSYSYDRSGKMVQESYGKVLSPGTASSQQVLIKRAYSYYANGLVSSIATRLFRESSPLPSMKIQDIDYTSYVYDAAGKLLQQQYSPNQLETSTQGNSQYTWYTYDAAGRLEMANDIKASIRYSYDAQGNKKQISAFYSNDLTKQIAGSKKNSLPLITGTQIYQYDYDASNRVIVEREAQLSQANVGGITNTVLKQQTGTYLKFDAAGNRVEELNFTLGDSATIASTSAGSIGDLLIKNVGSPAPTNQANAKTQIIVNAYDANNRLASTSINATSFVSSVGTSSSRVYNNLDQVKAYSAYSSLIPSAGSLTNTEGTAYNADGTIASQTNSSTADGRPANRTYAYDNAGNLIELRISSTDKYTYDYQASAVGYSQTKINATNKYGTNTTTQTYDILDHLWKVVFSSSGKTTSSQYVTNRSGQILKKEDSTTAPPDGGIAWTYSVDYLLYYGESLLGSFEALRTSQGGGAYNITSSTANFGFNYNPISSQYPSSVPGSYVVQAGDTLQSIAQSIYGDASLWYLIADANSLRGNEPPTPGVTLKLPNQVIAAHNNDNTFKPYSAQEIIGDINPSLPLPPPPVASCNPFVAILVIIVAIVVSYFTAGAATAAFSSALQAAGVATTAGTAGAAAAGIAGAAVGAAAGSVASQGVAIGLHAQDGFSWSQVGMAAVTAGLTKGINAVPGISGTNFVGYVGRAVINDAIGQGVNIAFRKQDGFSWSSIAAAAVGGVLDYGINSVDANQAKLGHVDSSARKFSVDDVFQGTARQFIRGAITQSVRIVLDHHGKIDFSSIAADAFGNALGNSIVGAMQVRGDRSQLSEREGEYYDSAIRNGGSHTDAMQFAKENSNSFLLFEESDRVAATTNDARSSVFTGERYEVADSGQKIMSDVGYASADQPWTDSYDSEDNAAFVSNVLALGDSADSDDVIAVQQMLRDTGYDIGSGSLHSSAVDGQFGSSTKIAAQRYLENEHLSPGSNADRFRWVNDEPVVTPSQLREIMPNSSANMEDYARFLNVAMNQYSITAPETATAFLAQIAHESGQFRYMEEIASGAAYEGRADLGNVQPGDGVRYKGRGFIQITGRANYSLASAALGFDFVSQPQMLATPDFAAQAAGWFWQSRGLNSVADVADYRSFIRTTKVINGGYTGIEDRVNHWEAARRAFGK
ncbi:MAG: DUF6531 domain-containing protein [Pseudomonadota bacterium]